MGDDAAVNCAVVTGVTFKKLVSYDVRIGQVSGGAFEWVVEVLGGVVGYEESEGLSGIVGVVL
jgi:hypothetical protein